tara:strand:- start:6822 stop:7442 length:621 start_codon:yes stop_codon:yes gene_type:complete
MESITQYNSSHKEIVEQFLEKARAEGSAGTYTQTKFDLDKLDTKSSLWLAIVDDEVASISYAERSFITDTPESIRKCRYHILKKHRHGRYGFKMMKHQIAWAKENGFKHYYWTHDVNDRAINKLFQHKRTYIVGDNSWFTDDDYKKLTLEKELLFHDSPKSDMLQYIYSYYIDESYVWNPTKAVIQYNHTGDNINSQEILNETFNV